VKGVMLPMGYATVIDFRNVVQNKLYVDKNAVDESIDDLAAPADVRSSPLPSARTLLLIARLSRSRAGHLEGGRHDQVVTSAPFVIRNANPTRRFRGSTGSICE
jgi:hypothetical protein